MRIARTLAFTAALGSFAFNGIAAAARPTYDEQTRHGPQPRANRVALFSAGEAVCQTSLIEHPQLMPRFIQLDESTTATNSDQLESLRPCESQELKSLAQMADLANSSNQVAGLPLYVVPAIVCVAGLAGGAWAGHEALRLRMPSTGQLLYPVWGVAAAAQALAMMTSRLNIPAPNAAAAGGVIGAACGVLGTMAGTLYYSTSR